MNLPKYNPEGFALKIFQDRYAISPEETFEEACHRVSKFIASAEDGQKIKEFEDRFFDVMVTNRFSPGGRIWRGANRKKSALINCFLLPSGDSAEEWGELLKNVTIISSMGGGIGISFDNVRYRGASIRGKGGEATGAVSLMQMVDGICNELRSGAGRRSALLFGLSYWHPDLEEFLNVKLDKKQLNNANISVLVDNNFFNLVEADGEIELKWHGQVIKKISARSVYNKIIENSLQTGDPGFLNIGNAEKYNNLYYCRQISCTNPCGEQALPTFSICCLGNIVLSTHVKEDGKIDWGMLEDTISLGVRFLDNVLDKNEYPIEEIKRVSQQERRIGIGVMGLHHMLLKMGVKYSSDEAVKITDELFNFIKKKSYMTSIFLSVEKGSFPLLDRHKFVQSGFCHESLTPSIRKKIIEYGIRNCCILTCPPTGTTSLVADSTSGIEPIFAPLHKRNFNKHIKGDHESSLSSYEIIIDPLLRQFIQKNKDTSNFEGSHQISPEHHCRIQEVVQKHIDSAVSKTINLPQDTNSKDLSDVVLNHIKNLKGMTIYRDGSKGKSPLEILPTEKAKEYFDQCKIESVDTSCPNGKCEI